MVVRFALLEHDPTPAPSRGVADEPPHWDLMIERAPGEALTTWRLLEMPGGNLERPIVAKLLGDHRREYLSYEGPLSGDRGRVHQVDCGEAQWRERDETRSRFVLWGRLLQGEFEVAATTAGFHFAAWRPE